jgi:hypothetical protein
MKRQTPTNRMIRLAVFLCVVPLPLNAFAAELSPWFGGSDQTAFQLDRQTMGAVTLASDPLQTGSLPPDTCAVTGCTPPSEAAMSSHQADTAPKN